MKKILITGILALMCSVWASGADEAKVSVVDRNGGKTSFEKSGVAAINLLADKVEVVDKDGQIATFSRNDISLILLSDMESGVTLATEEGNTISVKATRDAIKITGAAPETPWRILEISGIQAMAGQCADTTCHIDITGLHAGVYILSVADKAIKFIKR